MPRELDSCLYQSVSDKPLSFYIICLKLQTLLTLSEDLLCAYICVYVCVYENFVLAFFSYFIFSCLYFTLGPFSSVIFLNLPNCFLTIICYFNAEESK